MEAIRFKVAASSKPGAFVFWGAVLFCGGSSTGAAYAGAKKVGVINAAISTKMVGFTM